METAKLTELVVSSDFVVGTSLAQDIVDAETGEVLYACNSEITEELVEQFFEKGYQNFRQFTPTTSIAGRLFPTHCAMIRPRQN